MLTAARAVRGKHCTAVRSPYMRLIDGRDIAAVAPTLPSRQFHRSPRPRRRLLRCHQRRPSHPTSTASSSAAADPRLYPTAASTSWPDRATTHSSSKPHPTSACSRPHARCLGCWRPAPPCFAYSRAVCLGLARRAPMPPPNCVHGIGPHPPRRRGRALSPRQKTVGNPAARLAAGRALCGAVSPDCLGAARRLHRRQRGRL